MGRLESHILRCLAQSQDCASLDGHGTWKQAERVHIGVPFKFHKKQSSHRLAGALESNFLCMALKGGGRQKTKDSGALTNSCKLGWP